MRRLTAAFVGVFLFSSLVNGQTPAGTRGAISGKVRSVSGSTLTLVAEDGQTSSHTLPADVEIQVAVTKTMADIKAGEVVGSAAKLGADGKLHAEEVHFIPDAVARGRVGHNQMGNDPNRSMTNATVTKVVRNAQGLVMTLQYPGGKQDIIVANGTPVTGRVPGTIDMLKPDAAVSLMASNDETGRSVARTVRILNAPAR